MLIGVTQFFRDPSAFDTLRQKVFPALLADIATDQPIRVWVSGCSTGEEVYSMAMLFHDFLGADVAETRLQLFATDINPQAIKIARQGQYPSTSADYISPEYLQRYFVATEGGYQIHSNLRKLIVFAEHNILRDPPFSKLHLISCRNVLIYLKPEAQQKLFGIMHYALQPNGFLFLGASEALGVARDAWQVIDQNAKIFRPHYYPLETRVRFDTSSNNYFRSVEIKESLGMSSKPIDLRQHIEPLLLKNFVSPCVIANQDGEILYFHNRTGKYLEPVVGEAKLNVFQMARPGLQMILTNSFYKAVNDKQDVVYENVEVATNGDTQLIHLTIHPIQEPPAIQGLVLILFENAKPSALIRSPMSEVDLQDARDQRILKLERDLQATQEFLQTTREELETANEELKSTNEELQSTNEELETSKEEVNSVNEELISANSELQSKIEGLSRANNDLQNLLDSVEIGIIFLDNNLNIKRFNPAIKQFFNLIESDTGRSINDITSQFKQTSLRENIETVLRDLTIHKVEISTLDFIGNSTIPWEGVLNYGSARLSSSSENQAAGCVSHTPFPSPSHQKRL